MGKTVLKYFFLIAGILVAIGFLMTYEGAPPKPKANEDDLPAEQMAAIKRAAEDEENIKILGKSMETQSTEQKIDLSKLNIIDLVVGTGAEAREGDKVAVHYAGTLMDGTKFDSSYDRGQPFVFTLGAGQVIQGWDKGVAGMKVGGKRKLIIPPYMAYGTSGVPGTIPPNAILVFEVELVKIVESKERAAGIGSDLMLPEEED
jgi:FKBP-type peptidyl-prolyl cis-trans isomerase